MTARVFFAWLLMILGGLFAVFAGGCSILLLLGLAFGESDPYVTVGAIMIFGGAPFLVGALVFYVGYRLRPREPQPHNGENPDQAEDAPQSGEERR